MQSAKDLFFGNGKQFCLFQGQSIYTGKHNHGFTGLTYSERIAVDPNDDSA